MRIRELFYADDKLLFTYSILKDLSILILYPCH
jgi:hypothetical protein